MEIFSHYMGSVYLKVEKCIIFVDTFAYAVLYSISFGRSGYFNGCFSLNEFNLDLLTLG